MQHTARSAGMVREASASAVCEASNAPARVNHAKGADEWCPRRRLERSVRCRRE